MSKYCYHSPWCEDDEVCRCDAWREQEEKDKKLSKRSDLELFIVGLFLMILLFVAILASI